MRLSRESALKIHYMLDQILPPFIRDSKWIMKLVFKIMYKEKAWIFLEFKTKAMKMSQKEYLKTYEIAEAAVPQRNSDLTALCIKEIFKNIAGRNVLEAGCGKCFLAGKMSKKYEVTASDIIIDKALIKEYPGINFRQANIEKLPFKDSQFDTVVCTQTLEHVQNISDAIKELRRVAKKRLIIVVPKQRSYKYTFDLHLHFFPYPHSLLAIMGTGGGAELKNSCREIGGDLFYIEDKK